MLLRVNEWAVTMYGCVNYNKKCCNKLAVIYSTVYVCTSTLIKLSE